MAVEYYRITIEDDDMDNLDAGTELMNQLGRFGWVLVTYVQDPSVTTIRWHLVFKRE